MKFIVRSPHYFIFHTTSQRSSVTRQRELGTPVVPRDPPAHKGNRKKFELSGARSK